MTNSLRRLQVYSGSVDLCTLHFISSHMWVRIAQVRIVRMRISCACAPSTYHVIDVCTAARRGSVDISPDRRVHMCISPDQRVHGSAMQERRKNNKIINDNKNKMVKTLPKSKDIPTVVDYNVTCYKGHAF